MFYHEEKNTHFAEKNNNNKGKHRKSAYLKSRFFDPLKSGGLSVDIIILFKRRFQKYKRAGILYYFGEMILTGKKAGFYD